MTGTARTIMLLAAMTALFVAAGYLLGGQQGMVVAFLFACGMNLWSWWNSDRAVLRMHNAEPIVPAATPRLYQLVHHLAQRAGLPMPALYLIHEDQPNAFATGRSPEHAAVAVTTGLLRMMPEDEVAGVVAHELAHIRHRDTLTMTIAATLAGAIGMIAQFGGLFGSRRDGRNALGMVGLLLAIIVAPLLAMLVRMGISRAREYEADRTGAEICGQPIALANALQRLEAGRQAIPNAAAEAHPATASLFIVNPLSGQGMDNLFSTHPSTENRVRALMQMAGQHPIPPAGPWSRGTATTRARPWERR